MTTEALLAYAHILAFLTMVVFLASEAALCRSEWLNAAVVERLARVDRIYNAAAALVVLTGLARTWLGAKGLGWYWSNPLLYVKLGLFVTMGVLSMRPTRMFARWQQVLRDTGALPDAAEVVLARKRVMLQAHLLPLIPLAAVFLARGYGSPG